MKKKTQSTSSLAYKYGIQIKQNNSLPIMGVNPNLNIQDQYIQNLLKQVHFMNMEIKLLKQKQKQSGDNALWGVINRSKQPLVTNIVQSSQKYQQMRKSIDHIVHSLQRDVAQLSNDQGAFIKQIQFLQNRKKQLDQKRYSIKQQYENKNKRINQKVKVEKQRLKQIMLEKVKERKRKNQIQEQYNELLNQDLKQKAKKQQSYLQIKNDQIIEQMMQKDKMNQIQQLQQKIKSLKNLFQQNVEFQVAKQQTQYLRCKIGKIEKQIIGTNFQIMQLNESIKIGQGQRDKQMIQRKKITQDYQRNKVMLQEIQLMNVGRKQKQSLCLKRSSIQIKKAQDQQQKMCRDLNEVRRKLLKSQQSNKNLKNQVDGLVRQITNLKQKRQLLMKKYQNLTQNNQTQHNQLIKLKTQIRLLEDEYQKITHQDVNMCIQLFQLQRQLQYLRGRKQLLIQTLNLKDTLDQLKVQDLQKVVQKNNDLNTTVSHLMTKLQQIKKFSTI